MRDIFTSELILVEPLVSSEADLVRGYRARGASLRASPRSSRFFDDFLSPQLLWNAVTTAGATVGAPANVGRVLNATTRVIGACSLTITGSALNTRAAIHQGPSALVLGTADLDVRFRIALSTTAAADYRVALGLLQASYFTTSAALGDGVWFDTDHTVSPARWRCNARGPGSTSTATPSLADIATPGANTDQFQLLRIWCPEGARLVRFYVDDMSKPKQEFTLTALGNLTTQPLSLGLAINRESTNATERIVHVDFCDLSANTTTER